MDAEGKNLARLTENNHDDWSPAWSPDGKRIVFVSDRDERATDEIYVMGADGSNQTNLTKFKGFDNRDRLGDRESLSQRSSGNLNDNRSRLRQSDAALIFLALFPPQQRQNRLFVP